MGNIKRYGYKPKKYGLKSTGNEFWANFKTNEPHDRQRNPRNISGGAEGSWIFAANKNSNC